MPAPQPAAPLLALLLVVLCRVGCAVPLWVHTTGYGMLDAVFDPFNRSRIAAAGSGGSRLRLLDTATGQLLLQTTLQNAQALAFDPFVPDQLLAGFGDGLVQLLSTATGAVVRTFAGHNETVNAVGFHPTDPEEVMSASQDSTLRVWSKSSGVAKRVLIHPNRVLSAQYNPRNGSQIAATSAFKLHVWDVPTGTKLLEVTAHTNVVEAVAWNPFNASEILTCSTDQWLKLWHAVTGALVWSHITSQTAVKACAFSPDRENEIVAGYADTVVRVFDRPSRATLRRYVGHGDTINMVRVNPFNASQLLTASSDRTVRLWDNTSLPSMVQQVFPASPGEVRSLAVLADGDSLVAGGTVDNKVSQHDCASGTVLRQSSGHAGAVRSLAVNPFNRTRFLVGTTSGARYWDLSGLAGSFSLPTSVTVYGVAFHPAVPGEATAACSDGVMRVWDVGTGVVRLNFTMLTGVPVFAVAYSPAQPASVLATGGGIVGDYAIRLWNASSGELLRLLTGHDKGIQALAFHPTNASELLSGSSDGTVRLWNVDTGASRTFDCSPGAIQGVAYDPFNTSQFVRVGTDALAELWDIAAGRRLWVFPEHDSTVWAVAFSPTRRGEFYTASADRTVRRWALPFGPSGTPTPSATPTPTVTPTSNRGRFSVDRALAAALRRLAAPAPAAACAAMATDDGPLAAHACTTEPD